MEIIFWARQKLAAKDIARRLNISYRTIKNRLRTIYQKIGVHSLSELIDYCYAAGLDSYIPSNFIRKGVQLLA
ncbi:response regulator transcription factor [Sodalis glossinidius]|nr:helix-turn-helix transcriptional regulator [Sodalis glossinidius]